MNVFVTGLSTIGLWASLTVAVGAATPSAIELHPSTAVPGATVSIGWEGVRYISIRARQSRDYQWGPCIDSTMGTRLDRGESSLSGSIRPR